MPDNCFSKDDHRQNATERVLHLQSLLRELTSEDPETRAWAAIELGELHEPHAVTFLIDVLLHDGDADVRYEAYIALCALGDPRAIPAMFSLLNIQSPEFPEVNLYEALMPMREPAIAHLLSALTDPDPAVRIAYAHNLAAHCHFLVLRGHDQHRHPERVIAAEEIETVLRTLLLISRDSRAEVRAAVIANLSSFDDERAREALLASLRDNDADVRRIASLRLRTHYRTEQELDSYYQLSKNPDIADNQRKWSLSRCFHLHTVDELADYLHDACAETRAAALDIFAGDFDLIIQALADPAAIVRSTALYQLRYLLKWFSDEELVLLRERIPPFLHDGDATVREHALFCLCRIKLPNFNEEVIAATNDSAGAVRAAALLILAGYVDDLDIDTKFFQGRYTDAVVKRKAPFLPNLFPGPVVHEIYEKALVDPDPTVATRARLFFWQIISSADELYDYAIRALHDDSPMMRFKAIDYFAELEHPQRIAVLKDALVDPVGYVRNNAIHALLTLEGRQALVELLPHLNDPANMDRIEVLNVIREVGEINDVLIVLPRLHDKNRIVRMKSRGVLCKLTGQDFGMDVKQWQAWWANYQNGSE